MRENILVCKSEDLALNIINFVQNLSKKQLIIANQILRSGTSIGANIAESVYAVSRADFCNKLQIALKEANETKYWLTLLNKSNMIEKVEYETLNNNVIELIKILTRSIKTGKEI